MSQQQRVKSPLDVLQSMINGVLIETGKALRASNKEGGKGFSIASNRVRNIVPGAGESFHAALDEIECDIIRAKSVLLRDLEEWRAKRRALENPEPIVEDIPAAADEEIIAGTIKAEIIADSPVAIKDEPEHQRSPEKQTPVVESKGLEPDHPQEDSKSQILPDSKEKQGPTPPSSISQPNSSNKPIGLGINTDGITSTSAPATGDPQNSSIDSLFGPDIDENNDGEEINFDDMDFGLDDDANTTTQQSQAQNNDFDLSNFGNASQDFQMDGLQTAANPPVGASSGANVAGKQDDIFGMDNNDNQANNNNSGGENMDLDIDLGMTGAEDSVFDDMFFPDGDDALNGGGEMEHDFDNAFFGLD